MNKKEKLKFEFEDLLKSDNKFNYKKNEFNKWLEDFDLLEGLIEHCDCPDCCCGNKDCIGKEALEWLK